MKLQAFLSLMRELLQDTSFAHRSYLVGGVVRDHLLGKDDFTDFDLVVQQRHGGMKLGAFLSHRLKPISYEVFPKFGSARMQLDGFSMDFVETRKESYLPGKRFPRVRFGDLPEDVYRRDFTINSLYMELFSGKILDPSGLGIKDLQCGVIRTLRDPDLVMAEDYVRILRAIRFAATLDFYINEDTAAAIRKHAPNLNRLSSRTIQKELDKMEMAGVLKKAQKLMQPLGIEI